MRLDAMWVDGFRRFGGGGPVKVRLDSRIVCLIGANEVGKTSLLEALELPFAEPDEETGERPEIPELDRTRGRSVPSEKEVVHLRYRIEAEDAAKLSELDCSKQLKDVRWLEIKKRAGGGLSWTLAPWPSRDKEPRASLAALLRKRISDARWPDDDERDATPASADRLDLLLDALDSDSGTLSSTTMGQMRELAEYLEEQSEGDSLAAVLRDAVEIESQPHPNSAGTSELMPRIPRFVRFIPDARALADEYNLEAVAGDPPLALMNLAELAELDLDLLFSKIQIGETGTVQDLIDAANEVLLDRFSAWTQKPPVKVSLDHSGVQLLVHVQSGAGATMKIGERSDGLKQFVALVALTAGGGHEVPPVLLIDEVEMRLHYDAQADLIRVLHEQSAASQVIYSTHSAAALPEDLGSAVRVVRGIDDLMASTVEPHFWSEDPGFGPLLLAMGAGSLAFVPLRPAVIVEGGADLVLLPSLLKEAIGGDTLGYQVVPGAASVPPESVAGLALQGTKTAWILDGDKGGQDRRDFLVDNGVSPKSILLLSSAGTALDLEDLVKAETYVAAVNIYGEDVHAPEPMTVPDLAGETCERHRIVEKWFGARGLKGPSKVAVANKVLDLREEMPLVEPGRRATLRKVHKQVLKLISP